MSLPLFIFSTRSFLRIRLCALFLCAAALLLPAPTDAKTPVILILGDSLSAEYGLTRGTGWVALLETRLTDSHQSNYRIVNASVSGETTSGGASRLPALLTEHRPVIIVLELGANDALRGLSLEMTERNLDAIVRASQQAGAKVLIAGMQIPPNYGRAYVERFRQLFSTVASRHGAALVPFLLAGVAEELHYFQADHIHPNESAQPRIMANVWQVLETLL